MSKYTTRQILDMIGEKEGPEGLDLSWVDLRGIDLGRDTVQAELEKVRKDQTDIVPLWVMASKGINLAKADLRSAYLSGANLQAAYLSETDLQEAHLWNANLQGAFLLQANLQGATLSEANLQGAELRRANLQGADLSEANLQGADLSEANLRRAELWRANLREASLRNADLRGAFLTAADLRRADLWRANLQGADLWMANLRSAFLWDADLRRAHLWEADLRRAVLWRANLGESVLWEANLRESQFHAVRLDHTEIDQKSLGSAIGEELAKEYDDARDAYLRLKQNFDDLGDYAASAWAYQKERQMEKECHAPWRARSTYGEAELQDPSPLRVFLFFARHTAKWISDWIVEYLCGYGENATRVVILMAVSLFGFATYYWSIGGVWLVDPGKGPTGTASSFRDYLTYSLGAFTTTQFATFQAADGRVRLVTGIQAVCGIFLAGLLGFVVANKIRRS